MSFAAKILNADETRSTNMTQPQLDVMVEVLNSGVSKSRFGKVLLERLEKAGLPPDFNDANSRPEIPGHSGDKRQKALTKAFSVMEKFVNTQDDKVTKEQVRVALNHLRQSHGFPAV